jgi:hypothetical protein
MAEAIWYYAQDDREHGPVTGAYIAGMARTGKLRPDDLVWREGMEDWRPARTIKGLFTAPGNRPAGPASDTAVLDSPFDALPPSSSSADHGAATGERAMAASQPPVGGTLSAAAPAAPPPPPDAARFRDRGPPSFDAQAPLPRDERDEELPASVPGLRAEPRTAGERLRGLARSLTLIGLLLAMFSRGCEALGGRWAMRLQAQSELAEMRFEQDWRMRLRSLEQQRRELSSDSTSAASNASALRETQQELAKLETQREQARAELNESEWRELKDAAKEAQLNQRIWGFWREICVWSAALALVLGGAGLIYAAHGAERWLGIALLAVVAWTVFFAQAP